MVLVATHPIAKFCSGNSELITLFFIPLSLVKVFESRALTRKGIK
jgi:hypothetical protein